MLLNLPLELRLLIYHHLLVQAEQPVRPRSVYQAYHPALPSLTILLACRQIYNEAYQIFYRDNHFYLWRGEDLHGFLKSIGTKRRRQIRRLTFDWKPTHNRTQDWVKGAFTLLKKCIRLADFELNVENSYLRADISTFWGSDRLMELRGMKTVSIKTYGLDDEEFDEDVELNSASAIQLKRAWLTPRPRCSVCERDGPIV